MNTVVAERLENVPEMLKDGSRLVLFVNPFGTITAAKLPPDSVSVAAIGAEIETIDEVDITDHFTCEEAVCQLQDKQSGRGMYAADAEKELTTDARNDKT